MNVYATLISLISLALIWFGIFWLYRDYRIDLFRQRMFELRDEMFDLAAAGKIPFDQKSYGILRVTMNGFIRYAHQLNLAFFLITVIRHSKSDIGRSALAEKLEANMRRLSPEQQVIMTELRLRMASLVIKHIIASSPVLLMTLVVPILCWLAMRAFWEKLLVLLRVPLEDMSDVAFAVGDDGAMLTSHTLHYH